VKFKILLLLATIWAVEYDEVVKRGKDLLNLESIQKGNKDLAKVLLLFKI
jgi:hypothetical protein